MGAIEKVDKRVMDADNERVIPAGPLTGDLLFVIEILRDTCHDKTHNHDKASHTTVHVHSRGNDNASANEQLAAATATIATVVSMIPRPLLPTILREALAETGAFVDDMPRPITEPAVLSEDAKRGYA